MRILFTLLILFLAQPLPIQARSAAKFNEILLSVYHPQRLTFFCQQPFDNSAHTVISQCEHCPPEKIAIKWMMIVPVEVLAADLHCYHEKVCMHKNGQRYSGMRCCQQMNPQFQAMLNDLQNWVPELPALVTRREQYRFGITEHHDHDKSCGLFFDKKQKIIEPPVAARGFIARIYLYMIDKYHLHIPTAEYQQYVDWNKRYAVSNWERERNARIVQQHGEGNHYVG